MSRLLIRASSTLLFGSIIALARTADADEPEPPPAAPAAPEKEAPPRAEPTKPPAIDPPATPPLVVTDPPSVVDEYERGYDDFMAKRYAEAALKFDHVATVSNDPTRRSMAIELARRSHVSADAASLAPPVRSNDGRYGLLVASTLLGLSVYGPTLAVLPENDPKASLGLYMLGVGGSFFVPFLASREAPVTWAMTDAGWYGLTRGVAHGGMLLEIVDDHASYKAFLAAVSVGSIVEGLGATYWAQQTQASAGLTNAMSKGGDYGMLIAMAAASTAMSSGNQKPSVIAGAGLAGAAGGVLAGYKIAQHRDFTWGDGEVLRSAATVGIAIAASPLVVGETTNHRIILPVLVGGAVAGLVGGDLLLDGHDFTAGQGIITELSTIAGAATGAGIGYLASGSQYNADKNVLMIGAALGAAAGFGVAFGVLDTTPPARGTDRSRSSFQIMPDIGSGHHGLTLAGAF